MLASLFPLGICTNIAFNSISLTAEPLGGGGMALLVDMKPLLFSSLAMKTFN